MNHSLLTRIVLAGVVACGWGPLASHEAAAQNPAAKPAVVISLASPDRLLSDLTFLGRAAEAEQVVALAQFMAQQYLQLMDTKLPAGVVIDMQDQEPAGFAFLPVNDYPRMKDMLTTQLAKPQPQGGGIDKIDMGGQPAFMTPRGSFVFVSTSVDKLRDVPADPVKLLEGLNQRYALAVHCNVRSIPVQLRQLMITEMKQSFEREMAERAGGAEAEVAEKLGRRTVQQVTAVIEEAESATLGWGVERKSGQTYLEFAMTAAPGTNMAQKMNRQAQATTSFTGVDLPDAAVWMNFASLMGPKQIRENIELLDSFESTMLKEIADEEPAVQERVREIFGDVMKVLKDTVASGRSDGGGAILLRDTDPKLQLAAGVYVVDGAAMDESFRKAVALAQDEGELPTVNFNTAVYKQVKFHTMSVEKLDEDAKKVFGGAMSVAVGFGPSAAYLGVGGDPVALLKPVIDRNSQPAPASPVTVSLSLTPIIRFAKAIDDAPAADAILEALSKAAGRDHLMISGASIPNGVRYRFTVEDGVIRAIAKASGVQ